jgi:hypothetical protein
MKKIYTTLLLTIAISAIAIANIQEPDFPELQNNERYRFLKEQNTLLLQREDSIQNIISATREEFAKHNSTDSIVSNEEIDRFSSQILEYEEQIFELRQQRGDVITELNNIEQEYILAHMFSTSHQDEEIAEEPATADSTEVVAPVQRRMLIHNDIFRNALAEADYAELEQAQREDEQMAALCQEYEQLYSDFARTAQEYMDTSNEAIADSLFGVYNTLKADIGTLNDVIDSQWAHIIDTKYYAYGYLLERDFHYDLLDHSSEQFTEMQQRCSSGTDS